MNIKGPRDGHPYEPPRSLADCVSIVAAMALTVLRAPFGAAYSAKLDSAI